MAKYWADTFNTAKTIYDLLKIQEWMATMKVTVQQAQGQTGEANPSKPL